MTVGMEAASASSAKTQYSYLIDFSLTAPLSQQVVTRKTKPMFGAWANIRLTGSPQQSVPSVKQFVGGFENTLVSGSVQDVVRSANVLGGVEVKINNGFGFGEREYQFQPMFLVGGGFVTTPEPNGPPPVFEITPQAQRRFLPEARAEELGIDPSKIKYIGFLSPDRHNFFWQYYVGLRYRTHHFKRCSAGDHECSEDRRVNFPGTIDVTFGQNASVNGGRLSRPFQLFRFDAFYPLPTNNVANAIYLFGSAFVQMDKAREEEQIVLKAPGTAVVVPSEEVYLHTLTEDERRRDLWNLGVGVDLVRLFRSAAKAPDPETVGPEDGVIIVDTARLRVIRVGLKPGDSARVVPVDDVLIPVTAGTLRSEVGDRVDTETWQAFQPQRSSTRRTLRNTSESGVEALVLRRKNAATTTTEEVKPTKSDGVTRALVRDDAKIKVERLACAKTCEEAGGAYAELAVVVPVSGKGAVKLESETEARAWSIGGVVVLEAGAKHSFKIEDKGEAILVRLK